MYSKYSKGPLKSRLERGEMIIRVEIGQARLGLSPSMTSCKVASAARVASPSTALEQHRA